MYVNIDYFFEISYELTRFFLFCLLLFSIFKTFFYPLLQNYFFSIVQQWKDLYNKREELDKARHILEQQMKTQSDRLNALDRKLHMWHIACVNDVVVKQESHKKIYEKLISKKKLQSVNLYQTKLKHEVIPQAVNKAHSYFKSYYEGDKGSALLTTLLNRLGQTHKEKEK